MIRWLFLLVSDLERLIREKARVCEYVAVLAAEFAALPRMLINIGIIQSGVL